MKFDSDIFQIWLSAAINTASRNWNAIFKRVKFFGSLKLDTFAKSPDITISIYSPKTQQYTKVKSAKDQNVHQVY